MCVGGGGGTVPRSEEFLHFAGIQHSELKADNALGAERCPCKERGASN